MGYYTRYTLKVIPNNFSSDTVSHIKSLYKSDPFKDSSTWYDYAIYMQSASQSIPALMILDGKGQESGDVWRKAWLNGEMVMDWRLDVTPPEPSPELLERVAVLDNAVQKQRRVDEIESEIARLQLELGNIRSVD